MYTRRVKPFLDRLDGEARGLLLAVARSVSYAGGAQLVRHGEAARGAYVVKSGAAEASVILPGGERLAVAGFGAGALFGEMALIERGSCTANVFATEKLEGWFIERDDFRSLVAQRVPAALRVQHALTLVLSDKLRVLNARLLEAPAPFDEMAPARTSVDLKRSKTPPFDVRPFLPLLPVFEGFDRTDIDELAALSSYIEVPRGQAVFLAGGASTACFVVLRGAVEIRARAAGQMSGRERRIAVLGPGQLLGYMSALERGSHGSDAVVRENALLLEIPAAAFESLYFGASAAATKLHRAIQRSLLLSLGQTNRHLTRLISLARLRESVDEAQELERAYFGQICAEPLNEAAIAQLLAR